MRCTSRSFFGGVSVILLVSGLKRKLFKEVSMCYLKSITAL